jgi:hypothetical protein
MATKHKLELPRFRSETSYANYIRSMSDVDYANHVEPMPEHLLRPRVHYFPASITPYPFFRTVTRCVRREGKPVIYAGDRIILKSEFNLQKLSPLSNYLFVDEDGQEHRFADGSYMLPMDIDDASLARLEHPPADTPRHTAETPLDYLGNPVPSAQFAFRYVLHKWWVNLVRICQIPCWTCQYAKLIPDLDVILCFFPNQDMNQPVIKIWRDMVDQAWEEVLGKVCSAHTHVDDITVVNEVTNMKVWL